MTRTTGELMVLLPHERRRKAWASPGLVAAGHRQAARAWTTGRNRPCNIMIILDGQGEYRDGKAAWRIEAPCLFQHRSGTSRSYGPDPVWEEVFLCYPAPALSSLIAEGLWDPDREVIPLAEDASWLLLARHVVSLLRRIDTDAHGPVGPDAALHLEVLDRTAAALVRLSHGLGRGTAPSAPGGADALGLWLQRIAAHPGGAWSMPAIADDLGWSVQHLRRVWRARVGAPPERWLRERRLRHGRHLLNAPGMSVTAVAHACGFADPLHFSRLFRRRFGVSPRSARRQEGAAYR